MVITVQKSKEDILKKLEDYIKIFIVGCGECATKCHTGGEKELKEMKEFLEKNGKEVTDSYIPEVGCNLPMVRKDLRDKKDILDKSEVIFTLSCGLGNQVLTEITKKVVIPGCDTVFIGEEAKTIFTPEGLASQFEEKCSLCGECLLDLFGGLCPLTLCTKGLLNGPCGGTTKDGKCETDKERDCGWKLIYERLKELGRLDLLRQFQAPKNWSKKKKPGKVLAK